MMKICFKCKEKKKLSEFYKHLGMKDGRFNKCKDCSKKDSIRNRNNNIQYYRSYDRIRGNRQSKEYRKSWKKRNPKKYKAHYLLSNAVRDGRIEKEPCEVCGATEKIHGHHTDYSKPFDVVWLCPIHHKEKH